MFLSAHGIVVIAGGGSGYSSFLERLVFGILQLLSGSVILVGLFQIRAPHVAAGLVFIGVITVSVMWYWAALITVPVGVVLATVAYLNGRQKALAARSG